MTYFCLEWTVFKRRAKNFFNFNFYDSQIVVNFTKSKIHLKHNSSQHCNLYFSLRIMHLGKTVPSCVLFRWEISLSFIKLFSFSGIINYLSVASPGWAMGRVLLSQTSSPMTLTLLLFMFWALISYANDKVYGTMTPAHCFCLTVCPLWGRQKGMNLSLRWCLFWGGTKRID